ncbi:MAG: hypothetical protein IT380_01445 [Myxococcales bacterium]|nr:hypothetical protein [Myxococcales bacterium]
MKVDASAWRSLGRTGNAAFYELEPRVLVVIPDEGTADDEATAKASVRLQLEHLRQHGRRAGVVVLMDRVVEQTAAARAVYRDQPDPSFQACFALVGGTMFGRAIASIFIGLHPPRVPTKLFATFEEAVAWCRTMAGA